jgi:chromatin segregation and condensation protein Rec8/ScpA/Scc1 (kleisin family)
MYATQREPALAVGPAPLLPVKPEALLAVWRRFNAEPQPEQIELPGITRASVDERRARILDVLRTSSSVSFRSMAGGTVDEVIATFLAILELFRRGLIHVQQAVPFGDLELRSNTAASTFEGQDALETPGLAD